MALAELVYYDLCLRITGVKRFAHVEYLDLNFVVFYDVPRVQGRDSPFKEAQDARTEPAGRSVITLKSVNLDGDDLNPGELDAPFCTLVDGSHAEFVYCPYSACTSFVVRRSLSFHSNLIQSCRRFANNISSI